MSLASEAKPKAFVKFITSRAYFGRSARTLSSGAYLSIELVDEVPYLLGQRLHDILDAFGPQEDVLASELQSTDPTNPAFLTLLLTCIVDRLLSDMMLEASARVNVAARSDHLIITLTIPSTEPESALRVGQLAVQMLNAFLPPPTAEQSPNSIASALNFEKAELTRFVRARSTLPTIEAIALAAADRNIPIIRFNSWPFVKPDDQVPQSNRSMFQLGHGQHQKRLAATCLGTVFPEIQPLLADRQASGDYLAKAGIRTPTRDPEFTHINMRQRAVRAADRIGYPVVIKPRLRGADQTFSLGIDDTAGVVTAYDKARRFGRKVVVEQHISGDGFRLLVIGGSVAAARRKLPREPIPNAKSSDFPSIGGETTDLAPLIHPAIKAMAISAAARLHLEIAEVGIVTPDIFLPLEETGGAVVSVDTVSDLVPYRMTGERVPKVIASRLVDYLFPPGTPSRIPIIAVTGTNGKTTTCRIIARILQEAGYTVGLACTDGVYIDGKLVHAGVMSGVSGALMLWQHANVDVAILETSRGTLVTRGLAFDQCEVAACTNVASDHIGQEGIDTLEQMAALKRVVVETARNWAVLNGMDPLCRAMVPHLPAKTVCLIATKPDVPEIQAHVEKGGVALIFEGECDRGLIKLRHGDQVSVLGDIANFPLAWGGLAQHNIENILYATGATLGLGVDPQVICRALCGMKSSFEETPGRLNLYDKLPFPVIVDFAHNAHGFSALNRFIRGILCRRRRVLVFHAKNRHREEDIRAMATAVAGEFDFYICREPLEFEGAESGELSRALSAALMHTGIAKEQIATIPTLNEAVDFALHSCREGDVLVFACTYDYEAIWRQLEDYYAAPERHPADRPNV
jgi:cyanophycin synthetase